jgi:hypothetical protein
MDEFRETRDKAVRAVFETGDLTLMEEFAEKYFTPFDKRMLNSNDPEKRAQVLTLTAYKCIPEIKSFTPEERNKARQWLREYGSEPTKWKDML